MHGPRHDDGARVPHGPVGHQAEAQARDDQADRRLRPALPGPADDLPDRDGARRRVSRWSTRCCCASSSTTASSPRTRASSWWSGLTVAAVAAVRRVPRRGEPAGSPRGSARASSTTCAPRSSTTCSGSRWRSSPAPRPGRWSAGSTVTWSARSRRSSARCPVVLSNVLSLIVILVTLFYLSWQVSLIALVLIPLFIFPARRLGRRLQRLTPGVHAAQRRDGLDDDRAVQRGGAMLAKLYGRPREESRAVRGQGLQGPRDRRRPGTCTGRCS